MRYLIIGVLLLSGCFSEGEHYNRCYDNNTCNEGLICIKPERSFSVCLAPNDGVAINGHKYFVHQIMTTQNIKD